MTTTPITTATLVYHHVVLRTSRRVVDLRVEVAPGRVVLRGRTASYYVKQLAQQGALELVPGVRLENAIRVETPRPTHRT